MKTNRFARRFLKMRIVMLCVAFLGLGVLGLHIGDSLAELQGQAMSAQGEAAPAAPPHVDISKFIAAAR
jgi:hypothetical protein